MLPWAQEEIEKYRGENVTADSQRHKVLGQLEERLTDTQEQAAWYQHKHEASVKRVDQLKVLAPFIYLTQLIPTEWMFNERPLSLAVIVLSPTK